MTVLVYAEHNNQVVSAASKAAIFAANKLKKPVHVLLTCANQSVQDDAKSIEGVQKVLLVDDDAYAHNIAETSADLLAHTGKNYHYIIAAATTTGKNILPRVAALLNVNMLSDVVKIVDANTFVRPIYAGNAFEVVALDTHIKIFSIRPSAFELPTQNADATIETVDYKSFVLSATFASDEYSQNSGADLASAKTVIAGGRALGSKQNFDDYITPIAQKLGAAIGASRAAVDAGFAPNDWQVGQTGKIIAPNLYIAAGISGAIQHMAGIKDAKTIVAINNDPSAPICQVADYVLQMDVFEALEALKQKLDT